LDPYVAPRPVYLAPPPVVVAPPPVYLYRQPGPGFARAHGHHHWKRYHDHRDWRHDRRR